MNIVEKQAKGFVRGFYNSGNRNTLENLKSLLDEKIYVFSRDRDKLDFLKVLREYSLLEKTNHEKTCKGAGCKYHEEIDMGIFIIKQEIDSINKYYDWEPNKKDEFTTEEEVQLHTKLNEVLERLNKIGLGQEVIFEEIESLKNHFNLGKKTWFQLLKGKLVEVTVEQAIEKTIAQEVLDIFKDVYESGKGLILR